MRGLVLAQRRAEPRRGSRRDQARARPPVASSRTTEIGRGPFGIFASESSDCRISRQRRARRQAPDAPLGNAIHLWSSHHITVDGQRRLAATATGSISSSCRTRRSSGNTSERTDGTACTSCSRIAAPTATTGFAATARAWRSCTRTSVEMIANRFEDNRGADRLRPAPQGHQRQPPRRQRVRGGIRSGCTSKAAVASSSGNRFMRNGWAIRLMANSPQNRFERNVFAGNSFDLSTNSRSTSAAVAGNWWDRYEGYDLDRDGRGDVPFRPVRLFSLLVAQRSAVSDPHAEHVRRPARRRRAGAAGTDARHARATSTPLMELAAMTVELDAIARPSRSSRSGSASAARSCWTASTPSCRAAK